MGEQEAKWAEQFFFTGFQKRGKCDPNGVKTVIFLKKTKNHTATRASPDLRLYEMIELQRFAQLATQSRHFSKNFQAPPSAKSWLPE